MDQESDLQWIREFFRGLTHELSGPLTPLSGHLELLMSQGTEGLNPMQKRCLEASVRSVTRLKRFNDSIMEIARLERGAYELVPEETAPRSVLENACNNLQQSLWKKDVRVEITAHTDEKLRQDRSLMEKALTILLRNAIRHSPQGESIEVEIRSQEDGKAGRYAVISVSDKGPGVEPEYLEHIFRPFVKLSSTDGQRGDGPGLGLSIADFAARALGGSVKAMCKKGLDGNRCGTTFVLSVPFLHPSCSADS